MDHPTKVGFSFGLTSGIITTLGLMVGLNAGTHSKAIVLGGILTIAIADALSDALGIHISEETEKKHNNKEIWKATLSTFSSKFIFALTFIIPILLFSLQTAIIVSVIWGFLLLSLFSYYIAKDRKVPPYKIILEHLLIAAFVVIITHLVGDFIRTFII